jgi:hypothetical protein
MIESGFSEQSPYEAVTDGYRIAAESVEVHGAKHIVSLPEGRRQEPPDGPWLELRIVVYSATDKEASAIAGFEDIHAVDSDGNEADIAPIFGKAIGPRGFSLLGPMHAARFRLGFRDVGLQAPELNSLTGALVVYEDVEYSVFRFEDLSARDVTVRQGDLAITFVQVTTTPWTVDVSLRTEAPLTPAHGPDPRWLGGFVDIEFADGTKRRYAYPFTGRMSDGVGFLMPDGVVQPTAIVCYVAERKGALKRIPFRIENIPLPN